jgi:hypothetical protein
MIVNIEYTSGKKLEITIPEAFEQQALAFYGGEGDNAEEVTTSALIEFILKDLANKVSAQAYQQALTFGTEVNINVVE